MQTVDWYDVVKWCNARSQQAGLTPVYYTDAGLTQVYTNGDVTRLCELGGEWVSVADGSGVGEGGAGRVERAAVSVGQRSSRKIWPTIMEPSAATAYDLGPNGFNAAFDDWGIPTRVRWDHLRRTDMGYTTWLGMYRSGVGIGMGRRMDNRPLRIQPDRSTGSLRVLRGGNWDTSPFTPGARVANDVNPNYSGTYVGFRCVKGF